MLGLELLKGQSDAFVTDYKTHTPGQSTGTVTATNCMMLLHPASYI